MFAHGQGVIANREQAYFWAAVALKQNEKAAERRSVELASGLTPDQVARAKQSAGSWKPVLAATK
jgi:hypothetical protein